MRIAVMAYRKDLEELTFQEIIQIMKHLRPKLAIAERMIFLSKKRPRTSQRGIIFTDKKKSRFCEFEELGTEEMTLKKN